LTPQVQFLRSFRDDRVLQTFAGNQFMNVFNSFYYSWSPNVADTIRVHDNVATAMKPVLYPLIGVLQVSEGVFSLLSVNPEFAIVTTGFFASTVIAAIYFVPFALLLSYLRKYSSSLVILQAIGVIWLVSLTAIFLAEITQSSALMMTSTGTFILASMGITILSSLKVLPSLLQKISRFILSR
jgi:hypothetical protein